MFVDDVSVTDDALAAARTLSLSEVGGGELGDIRLADAATACGALGTPLTLAPGETIEVDLTLAVDSALGSQPGHVGDEGTRATVAFDVRANLADAAADAADVDPCALEPDDGTAGEGEGEGADEDDGGDADGGDADGAEEDGAATGGGTGDDGAAGDRGGLAGTGGVLSAGAMVVGAALLLLGARMVGARRRSRRREEDS